MSTRPPEVPATLGSLLRATADGSPVAFFELCVRYLPSLLRVTRAVCRRHGLSDDLAEDVVHDSVVRAIGWAKRHADIDVTTAWFNKIAENQVRDRVKSERKYDPTALPTAGWPSTVDAADATKADCLDLEEALSLLSEDNQRLLRLVYYESRSMKNVAELLGIGLDAAYKRLERSLRKLRTLLE